MMTVYSLTSAGVFFFLLQLSVSVHILLHKEDVSSAIGWMGLIWLAPLIGSILYVLLGINRIRRKAGRLHTGHYLHTPVQPLSKQMLQKVPPPLRQLIHLGYQLHPQHFVSGNKITPLLNGDQAYPRMWQAISNASREVLIASYIFNNDVAGKAFIAALKKASANGAKIRVLVDGVGLTYSRPNILHALKKIERVEYAVFLPEKSPFTLPFVNLRNHRKIMIIDGETAFFGGMNLAQGNLLYLPQQALIQDVTFEVHGPVLTQMTDIFQEDWTFAGGAPFTPTQPKKHAAGTAANMLARIVPDGPDSDYGKVERICLGAITCAQKTISIVTPYFLPENEILSALETAAMRGVWVEIILPQKSNIRCMDRAMRANFKRLLDKDIHLYLSEPPFDHSKLFTVDGIWSCVGSANWDVRSFKLNFENNMECISAHFAKQIQHIIEQKKKQAHAVCREERTPLLRQLSDNACRLLTPYY